MHLQRFLTFGFTSFILDASFFKYLHFKNQTVTKSSRKVQGIYGRIKKKEFFMGTKKYSLLSLVSNLLLVIFAAFAAFSINAEIVAVQNAPPVDGLDFRGLSIGLLSIIAVLALIYGGIALVNVILKGIQLVTGLWGFAIPCIIFEVLLLLLNGLLLVSSVSEGVSLDMAIPLVLVVVSLFSIIMNGRSIATRDEE